MSDDAERLRAELAEILDTDITLDEGFGPPTLEAPPEHWVPLLTSLRDGYGFRFFDWLSAVDELDDGFAVVCHLAALGDPRDPGVQSHVVLRTHVSRADPRLATASTIFKGALWHERETHEMFGIEFDGHPGLDKLLLPDEFEGHPLRKEFVLAARVAKAWPGAKEPGESDSHRAPSRRRVSPPGVPSPDEWGPRPPGSPDSPDGEPDA
jgi:NADH-quinone oxidoreductase subunit C